MDDQQRVVELLTEQNELLKKHLTRLKFSLSSLLLLMTATCCGLGFLVWARYNPRAFPIPVSGPSTFAAPVTYAPIPAPAYQLAPNAVLVPTQQPISGDRYKP